MKKKINLSESEIHRTPSVDPIGRVFFFNNRVLRAVSNNSIKHVINVINSGIFDDAKLANVIPKTWIAEDIALDGHELVLEHERIPFVTLPHEWSFEMLKDAILTLLKTALDLEKYGFTIRDGHIFNLAFHSDRPVFFDFGSIVETGQGPDLHELYNTGIIPLKLWANGDFYLANLILRDIYSEKQFLPSISLVEHNLLKNIVPIMERGWMALIRRGINRFARKFFDREILSKSSLSTTSLIKEVSSLTKKERKTSWGNYYGSVETMSDLVPTARFKRLIEVIDSLNLESLADLAGNRGVFSLLVAGHTSVKKILCSDYDENAIDGLYAELKKIGQHKITPMLSNFIRPFNEFARPLFPRTRCDIAVALAVSHHLLLSQGIQIDEFLNTTGCYAKKYVLVEFMPKGLWDGKNAPPVPSWYNQEWFRENFYHHFDLILEEQTEPNRVFFLGKKRCRAVEKEWKTLFVVPDND